MKTTVKAGIFFALIWIIIVLSAFLMGYSVDFFLISELLSLLLLLGAIFTGLFMSKKESGYDKVPALDDFKTALQSGLVYTIVASVFVYTYHNQIDHSIKEQFVQQRIEKLHELYPDQASYEALQENDSKWSGKSFDDFIENQEDQTRTFISSFFNFFFHLMALFIFSLFYSFFVMLVIRKVILR